jgi:hypothetical protein
MISSPTFSSHESGDEREVWGGDEDDDEDEEDGFGLERQRESGLRAPLSLQKCRFPLPRSLLHHRALHERIRAETPPALASAITSTRMKNNDDKDDKDTKAEKIIGVLISLVPLGFGAWMLARPELMHDAHPHGRHLLVKRLLAWMWGYPGGIVLIIVGLLLLWAAFQPKGPDDDDDD